MKQSVEDPLQKLFTSCNSIRPEIAADNNMKFRFVNSVKLNCLFNLI